MATHYITFTYSAAGGTGAPGTQTFTCATARYPRTFTATISSVKPTRAYYSFLGWSTTAGSSTASYASGQTLSFTFSTSTQGDVTRNFYAVWKRNTAYVYYNANGGTGAPSTQSHNAGTSVALSGTKPTRAGYIFLGWATSATATAKQYDAGQANVPLYTTTTLYAVWKTAASSLSASNGDLGDALTITITREVNTYTDTITWAFGTQSGTIATKTSAGSVSWTPAVSLTSEFPNSASGPCVLTCTTYNGDTLIGTTTKTITLTVPQSLAPTVSVSYADTIAQCLTWGIFVQSRSKLAFSITASGQQGATIASYSTSVNGTSYNSASFTTDVLLYNGSNSYTVTVTDSRGLQTVSTGTFSVVAYSNPSLTLTLCDRNDSDPDQVDIGFDFSVASVSSNNDAKYRLDYKLKSASTWTNGTVQNLGAYSGSISDSIANLDGGDEWDIRINVIDSFQTASVESEVGVAGNILLNSRHNGGLGLLMKSQADNQLDIGKPTVHHGAVLEQFGSTVASHSASGNYAKVCNFGHRAIPSPQSYTGNPVNFMASAGDTISALTTTFSPIQDLHGYDNPWPAGGGKNKLPVTLTTQTVNGVTFTVNDDGTITLSGTATASFNQTINTTTKLVSGESYKLAGCPTGGGTAYYMRSTRGCTFGSTGPSFGAAATATDEALYLFIHIESGTNTNGLVFKPMICLATETDTAFAPYENICPITGWTGLSVYVSPTTAQEDATTYSVNWTTEAGTVYGGTVDVVTGVLTVTHGVKVLDGSENWSWSANNNLATTAVQNGIVTNAVTQYNSYTQNSTFKDKSWVGRSSVGSIGMFYGASAIYAKYSKFTTAAEAKAFFADNPTTVVYELATPITITLTPQTVSALIGQNYIWSSANENISLTVQPNTNLAVDNALTLEWLRSSDSTPTKTTIRFNSAFGLDSLITDNGLCYMSYANDIWSFFVEKTSVDDIINIIDFHNPWSNSDMTFEWEDSSVSTLPTGAMQAIIVPIVVEVGTSNGWEYRLYSDKKIIATRTISTELTHYTTVNGFYGYYITNIAVPMTMANTNYYVGCTWSIGSGFSISAGLLSITTNQFNAYALSTASGTNSVTLQLYLEGYKQ